MDESQTLSQEESEQLQELVTELISKNEDKDKKINQLNQRITTLEQQNSRLLNLNTSKNNSELLKKQSESDELLSQEKEENEKLRKLLSEKATAVQVCEDRISELETKLKAKEEYVRSLDSRENDVSSREKSVSEREKSVNRKESFINTHIENKAQEIEKDTITQCKTDKEQFKEQCETKMKSVMDEYNQLISDENDKIQAEADRQANMRISDLETEYAAKQEQLENEYVEKHQQLDKDIAEHIEQNEQERRNIVARNAAMVADNRRIGAGVLVFGLICGIVGIYSAVVALLHGLLPTLSADARQLAAWISEGYTVIKIGIPIVFAVGAIVWALFDFNERRWVFFIAPDESKPDKLSLIVLLISVSISAFGGKWLTEAGINTVAVPIITYTIYFLLRSNWVVFVIVSILKLFGKAVKGIADGISDYFREAEPHQIMGNLIIVLAIVVPLLLFGKCNGE